MSPLSHLRRGRLGAVGDPIKAMCHYHRVLPPSQTLQRALIPLTDSQQARQLRRADNGAILGAEITPVWTQTEMAEAHAIALH